MLVVFRRNITFALSNQTRKYLVFVLDYYTYIYMTIYEIDSAQAHYLVVHRYSWHTKTNMPQPRIILDKIFQAPQLQRHITLLKHEK